ncbi:PREDICTED: zinc finger protein SNAI3 [Chrysochloris asiatica]|uniref:Zinc finger protein SNAI3 n=1 Tax=Chrysochloris asiatica TaxID=185453 RepID=A0A9B0T919_CHRAS|nr:PREDICTED: zinc finger protein SNAI3 [Chrysochloris asiatica]
MPRSFLVKTHSSHKIPNYGQLETQRETKGSCSTCGGLVVPFLPDEEAHSTLVGTPRPWDHNPVISCLPLPLPCDEEVRGASSPHPLGVSPVELGAGRVPSAPLRDSLNHLNLPPLLFLPMRWPPILGPSGDKVPDRLCGVVGTSRPSGCLECLHCHQPCHNGAGLTRHQHVHSDLQPKRLFSCKHCAKEYGSLGALKMHLRTHTLPCVCALCGKAFSRPWLLQGHIRTHTGEKPYTCSHCSRAFADRSNLRAHLQTHSDVKRYQCKRCSKTFSRMSLLARHEESGCCPGP